jgi:hypothetical protein
MMDSGAPPISTNTTTEAMTTMLAPSHLDNDFNSTIKKDHCDRELLTTRTSIT